MAKIDMIFGGTAKKSENHPSRVTKWIHYSKLKDNPAQYRYGRTPEERKALQAEARKKEEALADLIEADGEVLQDLLVRKIDTDEYEIIAGHHRRGACRILVEERGKEQYSMLPCLVRNISDVRSEFAVYSSNGYAQKTDYEIMCEIEGMKHLLETYPEEFPEVPTGRMVERLGQLLGMKKSTVGEYLTISKNLGEKGMEKFQSGEITKSAAVAISGMPEEEQDELIGRGITTHTEIKKEKQRRKAELIGKTENECRAGQAEVVRQIIDAEENPINETCYLGDLLQVKEKYIKTLAKVFVNEKRQSLKGMLWEQTVSAERAQTVLESFIANQPDQVLCLEDGTKVSAGTEIIEFWNGQEDLGACSYNRFTTQVNLYLEYLDRESGNGEKAQKPSESQPVNLNKMKNNEQRKEWLRNYKAWGVWYTDDNIGCTYYKYDFPNGARLIAETYQVPAGKWWDEHEEYYLHLIGGPEPPKNSWRRNKVYTKHPNSETELVEFLKFVQG